LIIVYMTYWKPRCAWAGEALHLIRKRSGSKG
jgi:hypothetical protein